MPVLLGTTTSTPSGNSCARKMVKTSSGKLVLFEVVNSSHLSYKTSSDQGVTWDSSWTQVVSGIYNYINYDIYIDTNDDIYIAFSVTTASRTWFKKLTYTGSTWTLGTEVAVSPASSGISWKVVITKRSNGDLMIAAGNGSGSATIYSYISTDTGATWGTGVSFSTSTAPFYLMPIGSDIWCFAQKSTKITKYIYTSSWDAGTDIISGVGVGSTGMGAGKISDSDIWIASRSSSGIKVFHYNGSTWDTGTLLSNNNGDTYPAVSIMGSNPIVFWRDYTGSQYNIAYRRFNGTTWASQVDVTSDAIMDDYPNTIVSDSQYAFVEWVIQSGSPYSLYFFGIYPVQQTINSDTNIKHVGIQNPILSDTKVVTKGLQTIETDTKIFVPNNQVNINSNTLIKWEAIQKDILSDTFITNSKRETVTSDTHIKVEDVQKTILSDSSIIVRFQKTILSNTSISTRLQTIINSDSVIALKYSKTITSDTVILPVYQNKFILKEKLYIITDTIPAKLIEVDISTPTPTHTTYILNGSGEVLNNGKDLDIDFLSGFIYCACSDGSILKVDLTDLNLREQFNTGETSNLFNVALLKTFHYSYFSDDIDGESIFVLDESIKESLNMDIRTLAPQQAIISMNMTTIIANTVNTDLRFLTSINSILYTDLRFKFATAPIPMKREDFTVYIDGVLANDTILSSININHVADSRSTATFNLSRNHDDFNTVLIGAGSSVSNKNSVQIYMQGTLVFTGNISKLSCDGTNEQVSVFCEGIEWKTIADTDYRFVSPSNNTVNLALSEKNVQLDLYDVLVDNIEIDNPIINITDENPKFYTGVKINLGTHTIEHNGQWYVLSAGLSDEEIERGSFEFKPNSTYFWIISYQDYRLPMTGFSGRVMYGAYIGTSLAPASGGMYKIVSAHYDYQSPEYTSTTELGEYTLGVAPFKEVSAKNGKYSSTSKWEDDAVGWWSSWGESYDYINYAKAVAAIEFERMKNINGTILPNTSASIDITLDAFKYYGLKLLTRINLTNTINSTIYQNNNGFPVSIKNININASNMRVTLGCDNKKSQWEINNLYPYPTEPAIHPAGRQLKHFKTYLPTGDETYGV